jgi:AbrB family looped-hinge helix DNA binding protein
VIPAELRKLLSIAPGTRIFVTQEGPKIVLEPVSGEMVDGPRGLFKSKFSFSEELKRQRLLSIK